MIALLWLLFAVILGCALVWSFTDLAEVRPRWAAGLLVFGTGAAGGIGLTSCVYFVCRLIVPGVRWLGIPIELAVLATAVWQGRRHRKREPQGKPARLVSAPILTGALLFVGAIGIAALGSAWDNNPQGGWDAWSIWNLRARVLAAPDGLFHRAWSPQLTATHPEYPLLTSAFIARCWAYAGGVMPENVPEMTAAVFFLALCAIGIGGVARLRSGSLGILYGIILAATPSLIHETAAQYADVPLACYFLGATLFAATEEPLLAGIFTGFAAWTKDEGLLFLVLFFIALAVFRRKDLLRTAVGAAGPLAIALIFRFILAHGSSSVVGRSLAGMASRIADVTRYALTFGAFAGALFSMGAGLFHPIYPAIVAAVLLRFVRDQRRTMLFFAVLSAGMLAGYLVVYIATPNDLKWQLGTSVDRLIVQVWPLLLLVVFAALRTPESMMPAVVAEAAAPAVRGAARKARKKQR